MSVVLTQTLSKQKEKKMATITVDTSNPENFEQKNFEPIPPGIYELEVANDCKVENSKSSSNKLIKLELVVIEPDEYRGKKVFDNLIIGATPETNKKVEWKIVHFALSAGMSKDEIGSLNTDDFKGWVVKAKIGVENYTKPATGEVITKNVVKQYIFPDEAAN
ncbi:MAG: DUF669 domain-containing protein [Candidatus Heimdallarchaeota archaeon]